jgi:hypothetical protein
MMTAAGPSKQRQTRSDFYLSVPPGLDADEYRVKQIFSNLSDIGFSPRHEWTWYQWIGLTGYARTIPYGCPARRGKVNMLRR